MLELIINPVAGNGNAKQVAEKAIAYLKEKGVDFLATWTTSPGEAVRLAKTAATRADTVIAFGGDGTVTDVAQGVLGSGKALGIVPCGTGNDFVKSVHLPKSWKAALDFILENPPRPVDCGRMNERFFMNVCGTGYDVMVLDYAEKAKKFAKGIWPYLFGVIRATTSFSPFEMKVTLDGVEYSGKYMICSFGNGRYIGGGIPITPLAEINDGLLDVTLIDSVPKWKIPFYLPSLLKGNFYKYKFAHHFRVKSGSISSDHMRLNIDGEIIPLDQANFVCEKNALLLHW